MLFIVLIFLTVLVEKLITKLGAVRRADQRNLKQTLLNFPYHLQFMSLSEVFHQTIRRTINLMFAMLCFQQNSCWHFRSNCPHFLNWVRLKTEIKHSLLTELTTVLRVQAQL